MVLYGPTTHYKTSNLSLFFSAKTFNAERRRGGGVGGRRRRDGMVVQNQIVSFEEGELERPRWAGETPLSRLVGALISFKPLYSILKLGARQVLIRKNRTAEESNIPWREMTREIMESQVYKEMDSIQDPSIVYPDYYVNPFHAYDEGNLSWLAAAEAEAATLSMVKRAIPYASSLDEANQILRGNWLQAIEQHHLQYSGGSMIKDILDVGCSVGVSTRFLADKFPEANVTGLDLSPYFLSVAQHKEKQKTPRKNPIKWFHANGENTDLPSKSFDVVSLAFVVCFILLTDVVQSRNTTSNIVSVSYFSSKIDIQKKNKVLHGGLKSCGARNLEVLFFILISISLTEISTSLVSIMKQEKEEKKPSQLEGHGGKGEDEETEAIELLLFQVPECYVYLIPPRKSAASYRADEWNVNKWVWEGTLKVISKGEECIIRLEDKTTGELYACAFLRNGEPHPVETVIDSSRYFVLRVEENIGGRLRHAFIGIGFRERPQAYDFQAALHDHMKYLNKKKTAEEMEQHYQQTSSVDYSLKEGETLVLQIKNPKGGRTVKSTFFEQDLNNLSLDEKESRRESMICLKPPPPPPAPLSPVNVVRSNSNVPPNSCLEGTNKEEVLHSSEEHQPKEPYSLESPQEIPEDDFGDFQTAV
ncbi:uncharacterized protein LOC122059026 [Macadamia integrifolia]|uniref:uncharacterized protein LOC122059026 n=1 Tax=Macadamia integrifolia TaxID=60698 RepID=UPI001C528C9A|nr:uncharacterized protein LOC122059026 [Macadamia integrifolia]